MAHDARVAAPGRQLDRLDGLGQGADLVHLDEDGVGHAFLDAAAQALHVGHEEVVADELRVFAERVRHELPSGPVVLVAAVLDADDRVLATELLPVVHPSRSVHLLADTGQDVQALLLVVELAAGRVEGELEILVRLVAGLLDGHQDGVKRLLVGVEVGGKSTLVPDVGAQPLAGQDLFQVVEHLGAHAQAFGERVRTDRHDHELLDVDGVVSVGAPIDDVHHGHRHQVGVDAADVAVQGLTEGACRRLGYGEADAEQGVGAQVALVVAAIEVDQVMVDADLVEDVHAHELLGNRGVHVLNGTQDALAEVAVRLAVPKFDGLVDTGAGPGRDGGPAEDPLTGDDFHLDGGIASGIQDLPGVNVIDVLHDQAVCNAVWCWICSMN